MKEVIAVSMVFITSRSNATVVGTLSKYDEAGSVNLPDSAVLLLADCPVGQLSSVFVLLSSENEE
jgi:hypothetical protein